MRILAIETSCDETGLAVLSFEKGARTLTLESHVLFSQVALHEQFGGVFPTLAKRAHTERFVPLLEETLKNADQHTTHPKAISTELKGQILSACPREETLVEEICAFVETIAKPDIDCIAVTIGPGLEPALWVGINAAKVLSLLWNIPVLPINHMEGHVVTALFERGESGKVKGESTNTFAQKDITFPLLALLVSGGHTELVLMQSAGNYKKIGATRDDAVGEAFDKVARVLGLPYPGGPKISALAKEFRAANTENEFNFPRPMQHSGDFDFSYSGLKTALLYKVQELLKEISELTDEHKRALAAAFEDAAVEVLVHKVKKAIEEFHPKAFLIGGGVAGNEHLQNELKKVLAEFADTSFLIPERQFTTDNAVMIGLAAFLQLQVNAKTYIATDLHLKANGNLSIEEK
ncbi:MAG TPA: tRNA (adenosine(37)-N6)-threonylcarbamoyltransferase complex transferase subunit TsaD [Candidatus Paceibacterota bacterium]|nr:tRNA (adenosine(37)-N6)-threonylcarbamoyltransferase complex transferase subunit TsaD [Candidatus Paceibacterota bacterium]